MHATGYGWIPQKNKAKSELCAENYVVLQCTGLVSFIIRIQLLAVVVPQFACRGDAGDGQTFRPKEKEKELA